MTERKIKKRFYRQEKHRLNRKKSRIRSIVDEVLKENFGRRLYNLKHDDELRLLTLFTWSERYKVPVKWMLKILIPIWTKKFSRFKMKMALGCRVATLVGKKSEEIIREKIWREFPHDENKSNWRQQEQDRISNILLQNKNIQKNVSKSTSSRKFKSIMEANSPESFIKQYKKELKWNKKILSKPQSKLLSRVKRKCFRNNPWM